VKKLRLSVIELSVMLKMQQVRLQVTVHSNEKAKHKPILALLDKKITTL
jgi:hypothetical protein